MQRDQDQKDGKTEVIVEPKTASPPEPLAGEDHFCQDSLYLLPPFKFARRCWLPSRSIFGKRTRAYISRASHHRRGIEQFTQLSPTKSPSTSTPQPREAVLPTVLFIISPRGNPPPPHWSRVLHHNGGPNQYKSRVPLCCEFAEFVREILAS